MSVNTLNEYGYLISFNYKDEKKNKKKKNNGILASDQAIIMITF